MVGAEGSGRAESVVYLWSVVYLLEERASTVALCEMLHVGEADTRRVRIQRKTNRLMLRHQQMDTNVSQFAIGFGR